MDLIILFGKNSNNFVICKFKVGYFIPKKVYSFVSIFTGNDANTFFIAKNLGVCNIWNIIETIHRGRYLTSKS